MKMSFSSQRQRELAIDDEEGLLMLQASLAANKKQASAKVSRVGKSIRYDQNNNSQQVNSHADSVIEGVPSVEAKVPSGSNRNTRIRKVAISEITANPELENAPSESIQTCSHSILGEIKERIGSLGDSTKIPTVQDGHGFPKAVHRKKSNFMLSRNRPADIGKSLERMNRTKKEPSTIKSASESDQQKHLKVGIRGNNDASSDQSSSHFDEEQINLQNKKLLASMTQEQIDSARKEALSRLSPKIVEFLQKRGRRKIGGEQENKLASNSSESKEQETGSPRDIGLSKSSATHGAIRAATADAKERNLSAPIGKRNKILDQSTVEAAIVGPDENGKANASVEQIRFDITGNLVGMRSLDADTKSMNLKGPMSTLLEDILSRDIVRQSEGSISTDGYTIIEACLLARSSVVQQRVLALRLLRSLLAKIYPDYLVPQLRERLQESESKKLDLDLQDFGSKKDSQEDKTNRECSLSNITKLRLWYHALQDANVAVVLRYSLDDTNPHVVSAAAEALVALLGLDSENNIEITLKGLISEFSEIVPSLGKPEVPLCHMQRLSTSDPWLTSPIDLYEARKAVLKESKEDNDDDIDEKVLAKVDPLAALLNMQILERIAHLLHSKLSSNTAVALLKCLYGFCHYGKAAADKVASTPGLLRCIATLIDESPEHMQAPLPLRTWIMRSIYRLCLSSPVCIQTVQENGLLKSFSRLLTFYSHNVQCLSSDMENQDLNREDVEKYGIIIQGIRMWQLVALHGFPFLSMDEAFPLLYDFISGTPFENENRQTPSTNDQDDLFCVWLCIGREIYVLLKHLWISQTSNRLFLDHLPDGHIKYMSQTCIDSIVRETLRWIGNDQVVVGLSDEEVEWEKVLEDSTDDSHEARISEAKKAKQKTFLRSNHDCMKIIPCISNYGNSLILPKLLKTAAAVDFLAVYLDSHINCSQKDLPMQTHPRLFEERLKCCKDLLWRGSSDFTRDAAPSGPFCSLIGFSAKMFESSLCILSTMLACQNGNVGAYGPAITMCMSSLAFSSSIINFEEIVFYQDSNYVRKNTGTDMLMKVMLRRRGCVEEILHRGTKKELSAIDPWDGSWLQFTLFLERSFVIALHKTKSMEMDTMTKSTLDSTNNRPVYLGSQVRLIEMVFAMLEAMPPGADTLALSLLTFLFDEKLFDCINVLSRRFLDLQKLAIENTLGGCDGDGITSVHTDNARINMLAGYAMVWLGYRLEGSHVALDNCKSDLTFIYPYLQSSNSEVLCSDSCLPLPVSWPIQIGAGPGFSSGFSSHVIAVETVLHWLLGIEISHCITQNRSAVTASNNLCLDWNINKKLKALINMIFVENSREDDSHLGKSSSTNQDKECVWMDSMVRRCVAGLLLYWLCPDSLDPIYDEFSSEERDQQQDDSKFHKTRDGRKQHPHQTMKVFDSSTNATPQNMWSLPEAQRLVQNFISESFGDRLFGIAIALLFRYDMTLITVQKEVLTLLNESNAIQLLPPLDSLPGNPECYLVTSKQCTEKQNTKQDIWFYINLLNSESLISCLKTNSMGLFLVVHRLATFVFSNEGDISQACGYLVAILRRLVDTENDECTVSSFNKHAIFRILMAWDTRTYCTNFGLLENRRPLLMECMKAEPEKTTIAMDILFSI